MNIRTRNLFRLNSVFDLRRIVWRLVVLVNVIAFVQMNNAFADVYYVHSQESFDIALSGAASNDSIVWESGTYYDIYMDIDKSEVSVLAEKNGEVIFSGASRVEVTGDNVVFRGCQFVDGDIGSKDVIQIRGSSCLITQINIRAYTSYKYLRVREESRYVVISYCNFENRLNLDDQNILSILVDENDPGYHKIQYCSFKNFDGVGNDQGIEPIRIGLSTQADHISRTVVEYCYFTQCNGDGEIISSKASQNVYRYNTFENNPKAELVLRHGSEAIVYGNFFLDGKGGVRVREGQNHYIYNNYFYEIDDRAIYLQNEDSDPLDNINIAFNTVVDCSEIILGGDGPDRPNNVTFSNNIFSDPDDVIFEEETGFETWIGNIAFGQIGIPIPSSGLDVMDPLMYQNSQGYFGLSPASPALDAAKSGYDQIPQFDGIEGIDTDMSFDLMGQARPTVTEEKDLGCNEYPHSIEIRPIATEENTGPDYNTSSTSGVNQPLVMVDNLISIFPNPVGDELRVSVLESNHGDLKFDIFDSEGRWVHSWLEHGPIPRDKTISKSIGSWPSGLYMLRAMSQSTQAGYRQVQTVRFMKVE